MKKLLMLLIFVFSFFSFSQEKQTRVLYKAEYILNKEKTTNYSPERKAVVDEYISNCSKIEMELLYNNRESVFRVIDGLNKSESMYYNIAKSLITENKTVYKNVEDDFYLVQNKAFEKNYIYKDNKKHDWTIHKDTMIINGIKCYKATTKKIAEQQSGFPTFNDVTITAWFTPEIPVSCGPLCYGGLPGLIMSLSKGSFHIFVAEIDFNYAGAFSKPNDGTVLNNEDELKTILLKQYNEIQTQN